MGRFIFEEGPRGIVFDAREYADVLTVRECVARLPEIDRKIAVMVMTGYTQAEIAVAVRLARRTVGDRIKKFSRIFRH